MIDAHTLKADDDIVYVDPRFSQSLEGVNGNGIQLLSFLFV
jgi:hypothetical protein